MSALLRNSRFHLASACLLAALAGFFTYQQSLDQFFSASDTLSLIETARIDSPGDLGRILGERMMAGTSFAGRFFRPVSTLSFSLDYALWKLNPFGYHLLNVLLHAAAAVLVLLIASALARGRIRTALLAGLVFATHPVLVETVPAVARRQDILEFVFCGLAYLVFLGKDPGRAPGRVRLLASLGCFLLALGSKETAVYLPVLVAGHVYVYRDPTGLSRTARARRSLREVLPYLVPLAGFFAWRTWVLHGTGTGFFGDSPVQILLSYAMGLCYPQDFLHLGGSLGPGARLLVLLGGSTLLAVLVRRSLLSPAARRAAQVCLLWLALPLGILLGAHCFDYRNLYTSVAPFSILASVVILDALVQFRPGLRAGTDGRTGLAPTAGLALGAVALVLSLEPYSPLVRDYPEWRDAGLVQAAILNRLESEVAPLPANARLRISILPSAVAPADRTRPRIRSVSYLKEYTIESWLRLALPGNRMTVETERTTPWPGVPHSLDVVTSPRPDDSFQVEIRGLF